MTHVLDVMNINPEALSPPETCTGPGPCEQDHWLMWSLYDGFWAADAWPWGHAIFELQRRSVWPD